MPPAKDQSSRPPIWTEGRQHAPFEPRSYAFASLSIGRAAMADLLNRCASSADDFGGTLASGRWRLPKSRLGVSGRFLPDCRRVANAVSGGAAFLARAARVVLPSIAADFPMPNAIEPGRVANECTKTEANPVQTSTTPAVTTTGACDPDLLAIRQIIATPVSFPMGSANVGTAPADKPMSPVPVAPNSRSPLGKLLDRFMEMSSLVLGYGLILMSLPWGAMQAALAYLNGEDLRKLQPVAQTAASKR